MEINIVRPEKVNANLESSNFQKLILLLFCIITSTTLNKTITITKLLINSSSIKADLSIEIDDFMETFYEKDVA